MDHFGAKLRPVASSFATIDQRTATLEGTFCTTLGISRLPTSVLGLPAVLFDGEVSPRELRKTTPWKPQIDPMQPCQRHICAGIRSSNCTFTTTCLRSMCVVLTVAHIQWLHTIKCAILITWACQIVMCKIMNMQSLKDYTTALVIIYDQCFHTNDETASLMIFDY